MIGWKVLYTIFEESMSNKFLIQHDNLLDYQKLKYVVDDSFNVSSIIVMVPFNKFKLYYMSLNRTVVFTSSFNY